MTNFVGKKLSCALKEAKNLGIAVHVKENFVGQNLKNPCLFVTNAKLLSDGSLQIVVSEFYGGGRDA